MKTLGRMICQKRSAVIQTGQPGERTANPAMTMFRGVNLAINGTTSSSDASTSTSARLSTIAKVFVSTPKARIDVFVKTG